MATTTSAPGPLRGIRRYFATRPQVVDIALGVTLALWYLTLRLEVTTRYDQPLPGTPLGMFLLFGAICLSTVPLIWRRSRPWTVLGIVSAAHLGVEATDPSQILSLGPLVLGVAVYAVGRHAPAPRSLAVVGVGTAVIIAADVRDPQLRLTPAEILTAAGSFLVVWLLGSGQRRIRADAARLLALTRQLHDEQRRSAERAVIAERARIGRDLHDVVAHHVSAIVVQAHAVGAAGEGDPHLVKDGVREIGEAADTALVEMRRMLGLLADREQSDDLPPEPSLGHLDQLVRATRAAGCEVRVAVDGLAAEPGVVPPAVQVSAYRIAQEALTNVLKHAGPTRVRLAAKVHDEALTVTVVSGPPAPGHTPMDGTGLGLIGMRERATVFGGTLQAGPLPDGGWRVHATLPIPRRPAASQESRSEGFSDQGAAAPDDRGARDRSDRAHRSGPPRVRERMTRKTGASNAAATRRAK